MDRTGDGRTRGSERSVSRRDLRPQHARGQRRRRRVVLPVLLGGLVVVLGGAVWLAVDAMTARSELQAAAGEVTTLQDQVLAGQREAAEATLARMQEHAAAADGAAHGPHWTLAAALPWVGPNVDAVQTVAEVVDALATDALPGLMDATELVDPSSLAPVDGRIDLAPLQEAAPTVVAAHATVEESVERVAAVDTEPLLDLVAEPVTQLEAQVRDVAMTTATAARAVQLLPPMLGADEPREYLLLVQNNAELRALGGIPGAVILLRAEDGRVELVEQRSGGSLGDLEEPVVELTRPERALFSDLLASDMRDVTFTPDFPRAAEIARAIWAQEVGGEVDGVLAIDPGTLALILDATGPVQLPAGPISDTVGGSLNSDNAAEALLNTVYLVEDDPAAHDAFFAETAALIFTRLVTGAADPAASVDALAEAARQGRLMIWSAHEGEQERLTGTVLSGELVGEQGDSPVVGVYFNEGAQAKMGYYLETHAVLTVDECRPDGTRAMNLQVTLTNTVPAEVASEPSYITGQGDGYGGGAIRENVLVYAPAGSLVDELRVDGEQAGVTSQFHEDLHVVGHTVELEPGQTQVLEYDLLVGADNEAEPVLRVTPMNSVLQDLHPVCTTQEMH